MMEPRTATDLLREYRVPHQQYAAGVLMVDDAVYSLPAERLLALLAAPGGVMVMISTSLFMERPGQVLAVLAEALGEEHSATMCLAALMELARSPGSSPVGRAQAQELPASRG